VAWTIDKENGSAETKEVSTNNNTAHFTDILKNKKRFKTSTKGNGFKSVKSTLTLMHKDQVVGKYDFDLAALIDTSSSVYAKIGDTLSGDQEAWPGAFLAFKIQVGENKQRPQS